MTSSCAEASSFAKDTADKPEDGEGRSQKTEDRRQKTEDRRQKTEDRRQKTSSFTEASAFVKAIAGKTADREQR
jgi:hypothetical protein